jgi:hypothetical protein
MNIPKGLKLKNSLVGQNATTIATFQKENVQLNDNVSKFDVPALYEEYKIRSAQIIELKTRIAIANGPIWHNIFEMAELKGRITMLRQINTREGKFQERGFGEAAITNVYLPHMNAKQVQDEIQAAEARIQVLQDEVDEFNHVTQI